MSYLSTLKDKFDPVVFLLTIMLSVTSTSITGYIYFRKEIISHIDGKMKPYESYLSANSLFQNNDPDRCLEQLLPSIDLLNKDSNRSPIAIPSYDLMLACARDSAAPERYSNYVKIIEDRLDKGELPSSAWHQGALGWYYLRIGAPDRAEKLFSNAIPAFSAEGNKAEIAYSRWGMTVVFLMRGNAQDAWIQYSIACALNPGVFNINLGISPIISELNTDVNRRIRDDTNLRKTLPAFQRIIERNQANIKIFNLDDWLRG